MHSRGVFRSETTSCMNNNISYFSTISRQAIVERIMDYAGEEFSLESFYAKDKKTVGTMSRPSSFGGGVSKAAIDRAIYGHGPVLLGDKPVLK